MHSVKHLIEIALAEDIGPGDITTDNLVHPDLDGKAIIVAKESFVIAGLDIARQVFEYFDPTIRYQPLYAEGSLIEAGEIFLEIDGRLRALLLGERTALNFLQRLSGIATNVRSYLNEIENTGVRLVDTRKTTPGWRVLEKYAVRVGGAYNHRMGLYDGVLIKDNHIAVCGGIRRSIERAKKYVSHLIKIEVEVTDLNGVKEAIAAGADVIMLDNMSIDQIKEAVAYIDKRAIVEVSGGVTKKDLAALADVGVDIISVGALTHSARCMDISMRII
ncbi:MAG: carboxylating nicotinate-nucleotide diphosphorylase [Desulfobacterales bacterium]|nr:carboxylating nicotinate-nucleotide diphosphorylase [Desulfobacterales bacterium]